MSNNTCPACSGLRSKTPYKHTCGLEPKALKPNGQDAQTFEEIKNAYIDDPKLNLNLKQKLELLPVTSMKELLAKLEAFAKYDPHEIQNSL
jgi:hypothetical protein